MMFTRLAKPFAGLLVVAGAVAGAGGCAATGRPGEASSYLIVDSLTSPSGAAAVTSDVSSNGGILEDVARVTFRVEMKDPSITAPSAANAITVRGYRVTFSRTDGRNTQGVDVPYAFDGAMTATVSGTVTATIVLVRAQAKLEAPLRALAGGGGAIAISTFADVLFYGADQAGHDVTVTARISVNFADWGDEG